MSRLVTSLFGLVQALCLDIRLLGEGQPVWLTSGRADSPLTSKGLSRTCVKCYARKLALQSGVRPDCTH
eukprot:7516991-Pyramimonas_sp.AAC.1